ncbi:hypothetical protein [Natronorubrum aibiense]|uniref:Uncharacterized protein n=1 Tax=Natronorubrum aibiense TaxID=348826 RepID=A0A5P9P540_9EURY|nr:hypothetical protein [Natronorubrum aibiense]QFU83275.1 hypothetical protein GCU68_12390 [Natronorubrum aibiense]
MASLNDEMADVQTEIDEVRACLREEVPQLFDFDVVVGTIDYNTNNNSVTVTVEPSSEARTQLSERFGGVRVKMDDQMRFEFQFASNG